MKKIGTLRAALEAADPTLARDRDRLLVFVDDGSVVCTGAAGRSFEWRYNANLIVTDFAGDPNVLLLALLDWARIHQNELLDAPTQRERITFEVDVLANDKVDLDIKLPLTERMIVSKDPDGLDVIEVADEPPPVSEWTI